MPTGFEEIGKKGKKKKDRTKLTFAKDEEINVGLCLKTLHNIVAQRGKKGTRVADQQMLLRQLRKIADDNKLGEGLSALIHLQVRSHCGVSVRSWDMNTLPWFGSCNHAMHIATAPASAIQLGHWDCICVCCTVPAGMSVHPYCAGMCLL